MLQLTNQQNSSGSPYLFLPYYCYALVLKVQIF